MMETTDDLLTCLQSATAADQRAILLEWLDHIMGERPQIWRDESRSAHTLEYADWCQRRWVFVEKLDCGAYLDAVMALMPASVITAEQVWMPKKGFAGAGYAGVRLTVAEVGQIDAEASTPALALAAAIWLITAHNGS